MRKLSLLMVALMLSCISSVKAQDDVKVLIDEKFDAYEVGDKVAEKGADYWTTWSTTEGGSEDAAIVEKDGNKCAYFKSGNDQVILLGDYTLGCYEIEFDIFVPQGKSGYYNILHDFDGAGSTWAMQGYLHMEDDGQNQKVSAGHGTVHAAGNSVADLACIYDAWMHFRFVIDIDRDEAKFFCKTDAEEFLVHTWQWSKDSFDDSDVLDRKLGAMNFYPPLKTSEFYLDNFVLRKTSGETAPEISFAQETVKVGSFEDDVKTVEVTFENTGTSVADYTAWIDYGVSEGGTNVTFINYDNELGDSTTVLGLAGLTEPTVVEIGAMYPASSYTSSVAGTKITHICYPFTTISETSGLGIVEGSDVTFRIYGQGYNGQPGEVLAEKVVPYKDLKVGEFTIAKFDEPVSLTGFNVWATVSFIQPVSTNQNPQLPLIFDGMTENLAPYGDIIRIGNSGPFFLASEQFQKSYGNVHIRITCSGDPVFGGWAELEKVDGVLPIGETGTINVNCTTFGLEAGKTYDAKIVFSVNNVDELFEVPLSLQIWGEGVEEVLNNAYNIYPNPTTGMVTVEGENIDYIAVYNSVGQLIKVVKTQENNVDMSACENGVYFFNVVDNAGTNSVKRVVVAK